MGAVAEPGLQVSAASYPQTQPQLLPRRLRAAGKRGILSSRFAAVLSAPGERAWHGDAYVA
jgi:hypothetical protein